MESFGDVPMVRMNYTILIHYTVCRNIFYIYSIVGVMMATFLDLLYSQRTYLYDDILP
jgi:hypothetical protein